jgi:hypothetical protein
MTAPFLALTLQIALGRVAADGPPLTVFFWSPKPGKCESWRDSSNLAAALRRYSATPAEIVNGMVSARRGQP